MSVGDIEFRAAIAAAKHAPDEKRGGCECGFCAWSVEHVAIMSVREALEDTTGGDLEIRLAAVEAVRAELSAALIETGRRNLTGYTVDTMALILAQLDRALGPRP